MEKVRMEDFLKGKFGSKFRPSFIVEDVEEEIEDENVDETEESDSEENIVRADDPIKFEEFESFINQRKGKKISIAYGRKGEDIVVFAYEGIIAGSEKSSELFIIKFENAHEFCISIGKVKYLDMGLMREENKFGYVLFGHEKNDNVMVVEK